MASGTSLNYGIENEITCPLCMNFYEDPKILVCGHIYCSDPCLAGLAAQGDSKNITCPECHRLSHIKNENVGTFQTAFHIRRLIDLHYSKKKYCTT